MTDEYIYVIQHYEPSEFADVEGFAGHHKIGRSNDPEQRVSWLQAGTPHELRLVATVLADGDPAQVESELHDLFLHSHHRKEWYRLTDNHVTSFKRLDKLCEGEVKQAEIDLVRSGRSLSETSLLAEIERVRRKYPDGKYSHQHSQEVESEL